MDSIVLWSPITTSTFSSGFDFACQSVLSKQSVQEAPEALSFNARGAFKHGKISHTICDTFEMYEDVPLTCAMEYRTASTAYHVLFSFDPTITSCFFFQHVQPYKRFMQNVAKTTRWTQSMIKPIRTQSRPCNTTYWKLLKTVSHVHLVLTSRSLLSSGPCSVESARKRPSP